MAAPMNFVIAPRAVVDVSAEAAIAFEEGSPIAPDVKSPDPVSTWRVKLR